MLRFSAVRILGLLGVFLFVVPARADVLINEIMYHPSSENPLEEYVELYNSGATNVNLTGWRFSSGILFTFPSNTILGAGKYLVIAGHRQTFTNKYPTVTNVIGDWAVVRTTNLLGRTITNYLGVLSNSRNDIDLDDASGDRVDSVEYADEGDWAIRQRGLDDLGHRGWTWYKEHDGLGKSLELINPNLPNQYGQNWAASLTLEGTPGTVNSVFNTNIAPLILDVKHFPVVPTSSDPVTITTRILNESVSSVTVVLQWRVDGAPSFAPETMFDDGAHADGLAGDGVYGVTLTAQANNAVVEFYIEASDGGNTRTWPGPAIQSLDGAGPTGQVVNALFQVDNDPQNAFGGTASMQPVYKLIQTQSERTELAGIPCSGGQNSDAQMHGTFISLDSQGTDVRHSIGVRNRGHGSRCASPPNYRVNFVSDRPWKGITALNLNTRQVHVQNLGSAVALKAGAAGTYSRAVQVRVNNQNLAQSGSPMFGSYAANEDYNSDWAEKHFPFDSGGNMYKAVRDLPPAPYPNFDYRGEDPAPYMRTYVKESNVSENDWTDLIGMLAVMGENTTDTYTPDNVRRVINPEQWLTHLAVMNLFGNNESGLNTGNNDDYFMYRGVEDPRFILMYHDLDQILGQGGSLATNSSIFRADCCPISGDSEGSWRAMNRFLHSPDIEPMYYATIKRLVETTFSAGQFNQIVDQVLGSYVSSGTITSIKNWMNGRRAYVSSILATNPPIALPAPVAVISGEPRSPTPNRNATLTVGGPGITHYSYKLNNGPYSSITSVSNAIQLTNLPNGSSNTVFVIGKNTIWQSTNAPTVSRFWIVNTGWPGVRLNEVLARNDSAVNHEGTFPDLIELYNEGSNSVDLSGMRLTDDPGDPNKFTFPNGTSLAAGSNLVVYANNNDGTSGFHLGFGLDQNSDGVYLYHRIASGGALLDSVEFGLQLADLSIGRIGNSGTWVLNQPTPGSANVAQPLGNERNLRINEWLAAAQSPFPEDFIELVNPDPLPVALGGMSLTDQPIGAPRRNRISPLSFMAGSSYLVFLADNDPGQGPDHLNFALASEQGEIALFDSASALVDCVFYGPQRNGISFGRCPDVGTSITALTQPTPGFGNQCPTPPPPAQTIGLLAYTDFWKYDQTSNYDGVNWPASDFDDSSWASGPGVLGRLRVGGSIFPQSINTLLNTGKITYYFRTTFVAPSNVSQLQLTHIIDDGAVFYLNGYEAFRYNFAPGAVVTNGTLAGLVSGDPQPQGPINIPMTNLLVGLNRLAVEAHQNALNSADIIMGLQLNAVIITNPAAAAGVIINEVLANNASLQEPDGSTPDWVELYNPSTNTVDLAGMSLGDFAGNRWVFRPGSVISGGGYRVVRFSDNAPPSETNTGFGLKASGDTVYLFNSPPGLGGIRDSIRFGIQAADFSIGRSSPTASNWNLTLPTAGEANIAATLGNVMRLKINEWMAAPASGDDWFEVYNTNSQPVAVGGCFLTDTLADTDKHRIDDLSFIGANTNAWQKFIADQPSTYKGSDHVNFKLASESGIIAIYNTNLTQIDIVGYGQQTVGVSRGRLPDGSGNFTNFVGTASPGDPNFLALSNIVVSEVLTHSDPPLEDAIELQNLTASPVNIGGWWLSDSRGTARKYQIPASNTIPANGFLVFYEKDFNNGDVAPIPFALSSANGDQVYLSAATNGGIALTGYRALADFGPAANGVSFGRFITSMGSDFVAMSRRTFGHDFPSSLSDFRLGTGLSNAYPLVGPIVISEIMYHPPDIMMTNDNVIEEFIELHNITSNTVPLFDSLYPSNRWRLRDAVDFDFPLGTTLAPGAYLLVVSFDPLTNPSALSTFQSRYGTNSTILGPYSGKLDNGGESVELYKPDPPQPDGSVPFVLVERIVYGDRSPWPTNADGFGPSLQRINHTLFGNDPANWLAAAATPGPAGPRDRDNDGMPDSWEIAYGLNPDDPNDAGGDEDHDGAKNRDEYLAGTDPLNATSKLDLTVTSISANTVTLRFTAIAGRTYSLQFRDSMDESPWAKIVDVPAQGVTQQVTVTDPTVSGLAPRFYRIVSPQAP